jgi:DNA-binding SARP family transcriptional activator
MTVQIRLLGDIEMRGDVRVVDIGHARQRCVLAVLLVDTSRPVAVEQLIDRVWADDPPQRASRAVYNYLSRLRSAFEAIDDGSRHQAARRVRTF